MVKMISEAQAKRGPRAKNRLYEALKDALPQESVVLHCLLFVSVKDRRGYSNTL